MNTKYTAESSQMVSTQGMNFSKSTSSRNGEKKISMINAIADTFFASVLNKIKN